MAYKCYELPNTDGNFTDVVLLDVNAENFETTPSYVHYAYTIPAPAENTQLAISHSRGIPQGFLRDFQNHPQATNKLTGNEFYYPGKSALEGDSTASVITDTTVRLGALEALANVFSGRITASDKDPFPHQLSLQQFMVSNYGQIERLLIADEVGLGKTIEAGLILRDYVLRNPNLSCLYLTGSGLTKDVQSKLISVLGDTEDAPVVSVIEKFFNYGREGITGVRIGSIEAARRYILPNSKIRLHPKVAPDILIIDECHSCAAPEENLTNDNMKTAEITQTYRMAYQMINGEYWTESTKPQLVILMSATPFRSKNQFLNLLKLFSHGTKAIPDAYNENVTEQTIVDVITKQNSAINVVWRQQEQIRNWDDERFFPRLIIKRPHQQDHDPDVISLQPASEKYVKLLTEIRGCIQEYTRDNGARFGGFAIRQLELRLTSSSIAGACYIFKWCVQHSPWNSENQYRADDSKATLQIKELIKKISVSLKDFDIVNANANAGEYATVKFASDGEFTFTPANFNGLIPHIYEYKKILDNSFTATPSQLENLANLGLRLLGFSHDQSGVENTKLNWLRDMLDKYPNEKFLIFSESLQTCTVVSSALGKRCGTLIGTMSRPQREVVTEKFCDTESNMQALIATSCADVGFDFQVARHIVHWDLHPSPAILMQRNGRLARLGQVADVTAYYLIVQGTFDEKREDALLAGFGQLQIRDESMKLKILGLLNEADQATLDEAINANANTSGIVDKLLKDAIRQDAEMQENFTQLSKDLSYRYVLNRNGLLKRLKLWQRIGFSLEHLDLESSTVPWHKPEFTDKGTTSKQTASDVITLKQNDAAFGQLVFDPAFKVFGGSLQRSYKLAGLLPWSSTNRNNKTYKFRPLNLNSDPIGYLTSKLARLPKADFTVMKRNQWQAALGKEKWANLEDKEQFANAKYFVITTHPIKEIENSDFNQGYMSFFTFDDDCEHSLTKPASAELTHELVSVLEDHVGEADFNFMQKNKQNLILAGQKIAKWLDEKRRYGGAFMQANEFFMPIPVALIAIID